MSTPETPRTWTLYEHKAFHGREARGPDLTSLIEGDPPAPIEVVEKAPVDAEREVVERERDEAVLRAMAFAGDRPDSAVLFCAAKREGENASRAERERLLDMLKRAYEVLGTAHLVETDWGPDGEEAERPDPRCRLCPVESDLEAVLREYGRLGKEES